MKTTRSTKSFLNLRMAFFFLMPILATIACYCNSSVQENQRGVITQSGKFVEVLSPGGPYNSTDPYTELVIIDLTNRTVSWNDPALVTRDQQPIGLSLTVAYQRSRENADIQQMWSNYNAEARDDAALEQRVLAYLPDSAKAATTQFTIWQMLGTDPLEESQAAAVAKAMGIDEAIIRGVEGRQLLGRVIEIALERELDDVGVDITAVTVQDVAPSQAFMDLLERRANAAQEREVVAIERETNQERLNSEKVQTQIELEKAERGRQVNEINARPFETSPALLQIELAKVWASAINEGDAIIFVPPGSSISNVLGGQSGVLPIVANANGDLIPMPENIAPTSEVAPTAEITPTS